VRSLLQHEKRSGCPGLEAVGAAEDEVVVQGLSSDGDELDLFGTRGGRNASELEKSIAAHQRNIHRNQVCPVAPLYICS